MSSRPLALLLSVLACLATLSVGAREAHASRFQVSPVRLELSAQVSSGLLNIHNQSSETLRFQVTAFEWHESKGGEMQLVPTRDVSFFPSMLSVPAGGSRKVRVGTLSAQGPSEKTYRVFVEELPPLSAPAQGTPNSVRVLTRMGIPVFLAAANPSSTPSLDALGLQAGRLAFTVRNAGNTHFLNRTVRIATSDSTGRVIYETSMAGWYVLAAGARDYTLQLPASACASIARLSIEIQTDKGPATASIPASSSQCSP